MTFQTETRTMYVQSDNAMAAALRKAGRDIAGDRLYARATDCLRRHGLNPDRAAKDFADIVCGDPALLIALIGKPGIGAAVLGKLRSVASDMNRTPERGGQTSIDDQICRASSSPAPNGAGRGQTKHDAQPSIAPSASARSPEVGGRDLRTGDAQIRIVSPARGPDSNQIAAAKAAYAAAKSIADTLKIGVLDGQFLGDVSPSCYERMIFAAGSERLLGRLLKAWRDRKARHIPRNAMTRDLVPGDILERMVSFAKYASMHGIEFIDDAQLLENMETANVE